MKRRIIILVLLLALIFFAGDVYSADVYSESLNRAKEVSNQVEQKTQEEVNMINQGQATQNQQQNQVNSVTPAVTSENQVQEQEATKQSTRNQGEEKQIEIRNTIQNIIQTAEKLASGDPVVGNQIMTMAEEQTQSMEKISTSFENLVRRNSVLVFFIGPNYKEIDSIKEEIEQSKTRIQNMNQVANQAQNQGEATILQEQIQLLEQEISDLETIVEEIRGKFSLFGWLARLF